MPRDRLLKTSVIEKLDKALESYRQAAQKPGAGLAAGLGVCQAYRRAGDVENLVGEAAAAEKAYCSALALARGLATRFPADPECWRELATCHNSLGRALILTKHPWESMEHFRQAIQLVAKAEAAKAASAPYRVELARGHHGLALAYRVLGERGPARENYRLALDVQQKLAADFPKVPRHQLELAEIHTGIAFWLEGDHWAGNTAEVDNHVLEALKILTRLANDYPDDPSCRYRLASILALRAKMSERLTRQNKDYNRAVELCVKLVQEYYEVPGYRDLFESCYANLGEIYWMRGDWNAAADLRWKAQYLARREAEGRPEWGGGSLAVSLHNWAEVLLCRGELAEARKLLEESVRHARAVHRATPDDTYWASELTAGSYLLYGIHTALKDRDAAAKVREEGDKVFDETWRRLRDTQGAETAARFCYHQTVAIDYLLSNLGGNGDRLLVMCQREITLKALAKEKELSPGVYDPSSMPRRGGLGGRSTSSAWTSRRRCRPS